MDHYNATVHNGALVSTRKGMVISKSKHQGTRFVNAFASKSTRAEDTEPLEDQHPQLRPQPPDDGNSSGKNLDESLKTTQPESAITTIPQTGATPERITSPDAANAGRMRPPAEPPANPADAHEHDDANMAPQSLNIPYLRPPVPKGSGNAAGQGDARSASPDDEIARLAHRLVQQYLHNVPQRSHTYEAIALVASIANGGGSVPPSDLGPSISRVCASMNRDLLMSDEDGRRSELAVVESIAAMAIDAIYKGRQEHWHVLMRGLRDIVDRGGGMKAEWGDTLNRIRKADVKGAAYSGSPPYLAFNKMFPSVSECLPPHRRAELAIRTEQLLQPCDVAQANIDSLQALAFFTQTIVLARHASTPRSVVLDRMGYAEDCLQVEYQLVRFPGPLRADIGDLESNSVQQGLTPSTETGLDGNSPINAIIRVAGLLYIEDLLPDAHSIDLYTILLTVLIHQTGTILEGMQQGRSLSSSTPGAVRPVLLWACLVGYAITNFTNAERGTRLDGGVFEDCASAILAGSSAPGDDDEADGDLALCEMLPLGELRSVNGDEGPLLRQLVAGHEARQGRRPS